MTDVYFMRITEEMFNNPEKYYRCMLSKKPKLKGSMSSFIRIVKTYYKADLYEQIGVYMYTNSFSVCYGDCIILEDEEEIKYISKNLIGGKLL